MVHTQTPSRKKQMEWEEIRGSNNGNKTTNIAFNKTETEWTAAKRERRTSCGTWTEQTRHQNNTTNAKRTATEGLRERENVQYIFTRNECESGRGYSKRLLLSLSIVEGPAPCKVIHTMSRHNVCTQHSVTPCQGLTANVLCSNNVAISHSPSTVTP